MDTEWKFYTVGGGVVGILNFSEGGIITNIDTLNERKWQFNQAAGTLDLIDVNGDKSSTFNSFQKLDNGKWRLNGVFLKAPGVFDALDQL